MQNLDLGKKIPLKIQALAIDTFNKAFDNTVASRLLIRKHNNGKTKAITVNRSYRIVAKTNSKNWLLMSHSKYNKAI